MSRPKLLDLFCCAGGAGVGYARAGFDVTSVDLDARALAENPHQTIQADALEYLRLHGHEYDLVHASPPCQRWAAHGNRPDKWPDLVGPTRQLLEQIDVPYVIENVHSARRELRNPVLLCGTMFGLKTWDDDGTLLHLQRHRMFETSWGLLQPDHNDPQGVQWAGAYGGARRDKVEARTVRKGGYVPPNLAVIRSLLGTPWIKSERYLFEAIPPVYAEHIGNQFLWQTAVAA